MKSYLNPWWQHYATNVLLIWVISFLVYSCAIDKITNIKNKEFGLVCLIGVALIGTAHQVKKMFKDKKN